MSATAFARGLPPLAGKGGKGAPLTICIPHALAAHERTHMFFMSKGWGFEASPLKAVNPKKGSLFLPGSLSMLLTEGLRAYTRVASLDFRLQCMRLWPRYGRGVQMCFSRAIDFSREGYRKLAKLPTKGKHFLYNFL